MDWDVFVIAGPSGVGKSRLSYPLARRFDVPIVEADDLFRAVEAATTPAMSARPWDSVVQRAISAAGP